MSRILLTLHTWLIGLDLLELIALLRVRRVVADDKDLSDSDLSLDWYGWKRRDVRCRILD